MSAPSSSSSVLTCSTPSLFHPTRTSPHPFAHQFKGQGQRAVASPWERRGRQRRSRGNQEGQGAMEGAHGRTNPSRLAPNPQLPPSRSPRSSATAFDEIHRLPKVLIHPRSRGSRGRRRSAGRHRPEKEERRGCQPRRQIGLPLLHRECSRCLCTHLARPSWEDAHHRRAAAGATTLQELQPVGGDDASPH